MDNLINNNNNEKFNLNEEKHIPFLKSLSDFQLKTLRQHKIINGDKVIKLGKRALLDQWEAEIRNLNNNQVVEIIKGDRFEELQALINEKGINAISPVITSFNEMDKMRIPLLIYTLIEKATKCFKYLLINGIEDPASTMQERNPNPENIFWQSQRRYEWDCMALAIYLGEVEIVKILEERGIEKGSHLSHIEAALLSYRNSIAKEILEKLKEEKPQRLKADLARWFPIVAKSNNIKGMEVLNLNGFDINAKAADGLRPIHIAALNNNSKEILEILITKGADIHAMDNNGITPKDYGRSWIK